MSGPKTCSKREFPDRRSALAFDAGKRRSAGRQYAYQCPFCRWWHLTSMPQEYFAGKTPRDVR